MKSFSKLFCILLSATVLATSLPLSVSANNTVVSNDNGWKRIGNKYYYKENGQNVTGWKKLNGYLYYFDKKSGEMFTGPMGNYYFGVDGKLKKGWIKNNNKWSYYNLTNFKLVKGDININGKRYIFDENGILRTGFINYKGKTYYADKNVGYLVSGWIKKDNKYYYLNTKDNSLTKGYSSIGNSKYFFNNDGTMHTGFRLVDNKPTFFDKNGKQSSGWITRNGKKYYVTKEQKYLTGKQIIDGIEYSFSNNGELQQYKINKDGYINYYDASNKLIKKEKVYNDGWSNTGNEWIYVKDGKKVTGYNLINGKYYFFNKNGIMQTGWQNVNGERLYFNNDGSLANSWGQENGKWMYLKNGKKQTGWIDYKNNKYYIADDGYMVVGRYKIGEYNYYFDSNGAYVSKELIKNQNSSKVGNKLNPMKNYTDTYKKIDNKLYFADISEHNGRIDFSKFKSTVQGAILRIGWGYFTEDKMFSNYLSNVKRNNIPYGVYHYSYALNEAEAIKEADGVIATLKKYNIKPDYPIYFDMEDADGYKSRHGVNIYRDNILIHRMIVAFCERIKQAGYEPGVYASKSWFDQLGDLSNYHIWLAHWGVSRPTIPYAGMWQFSAEGNGYKLGSSTNRYFDENYVYFIPR